MSRAFVKEDQDGGGPAIPERPQSANAALITPAGFEILKGRYAGLRAEHEALAAAGAEAAERRPSIERDLRYLRSRIERAVVVDGHDADPDRIGFGSTVTVSQDDGSMRTFTLVGEDEADPRVLRMSWTSPLGQALLGARVGETVTWVRPSGDMQLTIVRIDVAALAATVG